MPGIFLTIAILGSLYGLDKAEDIGTKDLHTLSVRFFPLFVS